jgi:DNA-binding GntR family transcriptional regulator
MPRPAPALEAALSYVRHMVEEVHAHGRSRLPSTRRMACEAGVSVVTMNRAVKLLQSEGLVQASPGRGIRTRPPHIVKGHRPPASSQPVRPNRGYVADRIQTAIARGAWAERLPSQKELADEYATTRRTIRHALAILCEQGVVTAHRRSYFLRRRSLASHPPTLSLVINTGREE